MVRAEIEISIIIPTFNRAEYLNRLIQHIIRQPFPPDQYEIIIIDSDSTDSTPELCKQVIRKNPRHAIRYVFEPTPGLLSKRHRGANEANGDIITFVDDDIIPFPTWLGGIAESFKDKSIQLTGGKSLPLFESDPPSWLSSLWTGTPYGGCTCGYLSLLDVGNLPCEIHPNFIWGLNLSIRKEALFDAGGFHPDLYPKQFQRYQGDGETGLTQSCFEKKFRAWYAPDAGVYHYLPSNRLTMKYFEERMFYQGICDSYSDIRRGYSGKIHTPPKKTIRDILLKPLRTINHRLGKTPCIKHPPLIPSDVLAVQQRMDKGYQNGYQFHQEEVKKDRDLLQWVIKEHYWDYRLPSCRQ